VRLCQTSFRIQFKESLNIETLSRSFISNFGDVNYEIQDTFLDVLVMICKLDTYQYTYQNDQVNTSELFHTLLITIIVSRHFTRCRNFHCELLTLSSLSPIYYLNPLICQ